jgi:hypothetical protein
MEGRVRAIGVSNFTAKHVQQLMEVAHVPPMVNQAGTCSCTCANKNGGRGVERGIWTERGMGEGGHSSLFLDAIVASCRQWWPHMRQALRALL